MHDTLIYRDHCRESTGARRSFGIRLWDTTVVRPNRTSTGGQVCRLLVFHICIFLDLFLRQRQHCLHPVQQHRQVHWHRMKRVCVSVECGEMKKVEDSPLQGHRTFTRTVDSEEMGRAQCWNELIGRWEGNDYKGVQSRKHIGDS